MQKTKSIALILGVLAMSFLVGYLAFAWTDPTASPPGGNVPVPINVGNVGQSKAGGLILNTGGAPVGLIVDKGNVGIGITIPAQRLHVAGYTRADSGFCIGTSCITSWPSVGGAPVGASYVVMALDGTLTTERRLTAGTGITISDGGANNNVTVGLSYPSKSCSSGYAIRSFDVGSNAAPICVAVGGGGGGGDITAVYAGPGLIGGGTSGDVTLSLAQSGTCYYTGYVETGCSDSMVYCNTGYYVKNVQDMGLHNCNCLAASWECSWLRIRCCKLW